MLSRTKRLDAKTVSKLRKKAQLSRFSNFRLYYNHIPTSSIDRHSCVVSKKIAKNAVSRNTIRRQIYEAIRQQIFPPGEYVWIVTTHNKDRTIEIAHIARELSQKNVQ